MYYLQLLLNGVIAGGVYALFAVGLTMVYGTFRFINFAHGELIAWGAYGVLLFASEPVGMPLWAAALPAVALTCAIGLAQDRFVYRPLRQSHAITLLIASIGLSFFLRSLLVLCFGSDLRTYGTAVSEGYELAGLVVTKVQLGMLGMALAFMAGLYLIFTRTLLGKAMRAVSDSQDLSLIYALPMRKIRLAVWVLASVFAAAGGIMQGLDTSLEPMMGLTNLIKAFAAVLLGGAGNVFGALLGGLFIGVAENLSIAFFDPGYKDFIAFAVIILMLLVRPQGLFAVSTGVR
jgi:branched-chain amino acid transport system permease protein/neutral amino acid transport system permease protein